MIYATLILSVLAGIAAVHWLDLANPRRVKLVTAFTGAYLMALTCLHLIPEVFAGNDHHGHGDSHSHHSPDAVLLGAFVLAGFFLQVVIDNFSEGIEHGHDHQHHHSSTGAMMAGLCLHAFLEATPLHHAHDAHLLVGIAVHKFPVSVVLLGMLLQQKFPQKKAYGYLILFAIMAPAGALIGNLPALERYAPILLALVIGIFMHVSTTILFESGEDHHYNRRKAMAIILGAVLAAAGVLMMPGHSH